MAADLTTYQYLLKQFFLPGLRSDLNDNVFILSQVEKGSDMVEGLEIVQSVHLGRNEGVGARAEGGTLPTAQNQGIFKTRSGLKYNYGAIKLSGPLLATARTDRGSFARPMEVEMQRITTDLKVDINRQLWGDGTGAICDVSGSNSTTTIPVGTLTAAERRQLRPGMTIDVGTSAGVMKNATAMTISSVTSSTIVVAAAPATATTASDFVYRNGSYGNELTGLRKIVAASGDVHNLNPSTTGAERWKSTVVTSYGSAITEDVVIATAQEVNANTGEDVNLIVTNRGINRDFLSLLEDLRRTSMPATLNGGYKGVDISWVGQGMSGAKTVALVWDADCPASSVFGLNTNHLFWHRASDWDFMDKDGAILARDPNRTDSYTAELFCYADLGTDSRASHFLIGGVTEPTAPTFA